MAPFTKDSDKTLNAKIAASNAGLSGLYHDESSDAKAKRNAYHGDMSYGEAFEQPVPNTISNKLKEGVSTAIWNPRTTGGVITSLFTSQGLDLEKAASLAAQWKENSALRRQILNDRVTQYWDRMLHPPPSFLGDAFQYRTVDGKFNNVQFPHLGQGGAPYARTVPAKSRLLGAQPDPGVIFDKLLARNGDGLESESGLSSFLLYHATIIIHDIFRTNESDRNISDTSSYLDLSPLYGYNEETCNKVRDRSQFRGLLKPDTFSEERLLRQPPGVCIMLVMYNRYHNFVARQLYRINENGRFQVPKIYRNPNKKDAITDYAKSLDKSNMDTFHANLKKYEENYDIVWRKLDDDLYNTARLITCGMYINISIHDYLRALMGFHSWDTTFTLDPRTCINVNGNKEGPPRGGGNQVSVEFNVLYRFHSAISRHDEEWAIKALSAIHGGQNNEDLTPEELQKIAEDARNQKAMNPEDRTFGLKRDPVTGLFKDDEMLSRLLEAMNAPLGEFGPQNIPKFMRPVEIRGILQARKWEVGTLNDFREFFGMPRHQTFESVTPNVEIQDALRDLYEHPDKIELYPGVFCECDENKRMGPGPKNMGGTLWTAIFSDAISLVRSDRFYTTDWNTNSLTAWGMKEVTPDDDVLKSSVFHRLFQRAFPGRFPYNSLYFFHPFFTPKANEELARQQKYLSGLEYKKLDVTKAPKAPKIIKTFTLAKELLTTHPHVLIEPASEDPTAIDPLLKEMLNRRKSADALKEHPTDTEVLEEKQLQKLIYEYIDTTTRTIIEREVIRVQRYPEPNADDIKNKGLGVHQYHVDIVRDVAVPVVTHLVGNFLGIDHLIKTDTNPKGKYSENEIYKHVTNCQMFFAYNTDETKLLKRRKAFKDSMDFMLEQARKSISSAKPWAIFSFLGSTSKFAIDANKTSKENLTEYGKAMMREVLRQEGGNVDKAAAAIVLIALDAAFNTVLTFTSILEYFLDGATPQKNPEPWKKARHGGFQHWKEMHDIAINEKNTEEAYRKIKGYCLEAQRLKLKLPIVRQSKEQIKVNGEIIAESGDIIIIDINSALRDGDAIHFGDHGEPVPNPAVPSSRVNKQGHKVGEKIWENPDEFNAARYNYGTHMPYLPYGHGLSEGVFVTLKNLDMRKISLWCITSMITVLAQLQNLQPAPGTQGTVKRINIIQKDNIANYMSPKKRREIEKKMDEAGAKDLSPREIKVRTYLTPEWDEMVPYPCTWKVRFDGYGPYLEDLEDTPRREDDEYDLYQLPGPSVYGGIFTKLPDPPKDEAKPGHGGKNGVSHHPYLGAPLPKLELINPGGNPLPGCGIAG